MLHGMFVDGLGRLFQIRCWSLTFMGPCHMAAPSPNPSAKLLYF